MSRSPGPLMDAEVARRLWRAVIIHDSVAGESYMVGQDRSKVALPRYSSDVEDCYRVVGFMHSKGFVLRVSNVTEGEPHWIAAFVRGDGRNYRFNRAETMTMAICLAAIDALDGKNVAA